MALLSCPECETNVSDKAFACPSCDYPLRAPQNKSASSWPDVTGQVAITCISARAIAQVIVGIVLFAGFFALMAAIVIYS
ncbi:zinc ribbon domain-containing protein [Paracoccus tegillarcae]|uniref:Zinc ribbon domain-containing protein n=1 Tax=Paracoccus tegillarcae TaxID=1529068 RepID=A0A2K9EDN6_9RHOB|nr:zinc ribbon domain-containing protein [Paracoccus tegillarcae]AUH33068.1 zinc ribbon domain-containing protein [Paracoccus tegillarcae]